MATEQVKAKAGSARELGKIQGKERVKEDVSWYKVGKTRQEEHRSKYPKLKRNMQKGM